MTTLLEPIRLKDDALKLTEAERTELGSYALSGPSSEMQLRMLTKLEADLGAPAPEQAGGAQKRVPWWKLGAFCLVLALGSALWPEAPKPARPSAPREPTRIFEALPSVATPEPIPEQPAPVEKTVITPVARPVQRASKAPPADPLDELKLLTRARRVLPSRPETSLALTAEHARFYPHGVLAEEREVLAIEALLKLARRPEAERRARAFLRLFPNSSQRERLDTFLTQHEETP